MISQFPSLQKNVSDLQASISQIQQQNQAVTQLQQQQNKIATKFIQINASGSDPSQNGLYIAAADDNSNAIITARITQPSKGQAFTSYDHNGVTGWSSGLDANDQNKYKIAPHWDNPGSDTAITINNLATQKNRNVGIGTSDPQADLHVKGRILADNNIDASSDISANNITAKTGFFAPWANINNGGGALLNVNSRGAGNPNSDAAKIWADPGKDATLTLQHTQDNKNSMGVTFDHQNVASWRVGMNQDNEFRIANSWSDTNANPAIKVQNGRDWMTLFANHVNICNPSGQNCRTIYG